MIVTDGFTGNVALKTGEGTARFVRDMLAEAFRATFLSQDRGAAGDDLAQAAVAAASTRAGSTAACSSG